MMEERNRREFGGEARIEYILEGNMDKTVHVCDRCRTIFDEPGVGGCPCNGWPVRTRVENAIKQLEARHTVTRTGSVIETAKYLRCEQERLQREYGSAKRAHALAHPGRSEGLKSQQLVDATRAVASMGHVSEDGCCSPPALRKVMDSQSSALSSGSSRFRVGESRDATPSRTQPSLHEAFNAIKPRHASASPGCSSVDPLLGPLMDNSCAAGSEPPRKKPRRPTGHTSKAPKRPESMDKTHAFPHYRSFNFAYLVLMDRAERKRNAEASTKRAIDGTTTSLEFTKEDLMSMAKAEVGKLCDKDPFEKTTTGPFPYTGWSSIHKGLINRPLPWVPLVREYSSRSLRCKVYLLTEAGRVVAQQMHREAEGRGVCCCGLVAPSRKCTSKGTLGLFEERLPALRSALTAEAFAAREEWVKSFVEWERREEQFQSAMEKWEHARIQSDGETETSTNQEGAPDGKGRVASVKANVRRAASSSASLRPMQGVAKEKSCLPPIAYDSSDEEECLDAVLTAAGQPNTGEVRRASSPALKRRSLADAPECDLSFTLIACGFSEREALSSLAQCRGSPRARLNAAMDQLYANMTSKTHMASSAAAAAEHIGDREYIELD